jgi:catechol-2,3-dioxygenase
MTQSLGIDHPGLTVADPDARPGFVVRALGWEQFGGTPEGPVACVTDGHARLTLWPQKGEDQRRLHAHVGLHHTAGKVPDRATLPALFAKIGASPGVEVAFAPAYSGTGPKEHFMIRAPGGTGLEFSHDPR